MRGYLKESPYEPVFRSYEADGHRIRYVVIGPDSLPVTMLLHGTPGSASAFKSYMKDPKLLKETCLVVVDRPGYGYSDFGNLVVSRKQQAQMLSPLVDKFSSNGLVIAGHSYGGTLAARLAMMHPEQVGGLVLIAAAAKPGAEKIYKVSYSLQSRLGQWITPASFRMANEEKLAHEQELKAMEPFWERISSPVTILHGTEDDLIYPENAHFAEEQLKSAPVEKKMLAGKNHLLIWNSQEEVRQALLKHVRDLACQPTQAAEQVEETAH